MIKTRSITVHRIHLKSAATLLDPRVFCLEEKNILGVGYWVPGLNDTSDIDHYMIVAQEYYKQRENGKYYNGWKRSINALRRISENDLVWTRDEKGVYFLGRVKGRWKYSGSKKHKDADICSYYDCDWLSVGTADMVPGYVVNSLIRGTAIRRVRDDNKTIAWYSAKLWNEHSNSIQYDLSDKPISPDMWELLSHEDCEDVVGLFLQLKKGYAIIPGTCKASTAGYEYVLTHRETGLKAIVQVKQGSSTRLTVSDYEAFVKFGEVFLFNSKGLYDLGDQRTKVVCLDVQEIERFARNHYQVLPARIKAWIKKNRHEN